MSTHAIKHIAIIPDGNRRWAKKQNLPVFEGHRVGAEKVLPAIIEKAHELGITYLTFWALSPQNLQRSAYEVEGLFKLLRYFLKRKIQEFVKKNIRLDIIGSQVGLPHDIVDLISNAKKITEKNTKMTVIFAINYGGRDEIIRAVNSIIKTKKDQQDINEHDFSQHLDTANIPDPDLIIRTGGEIRLSGFMLWQCEYSEYYFTNILFPDFTVVDFEQAIQYFQERNRRFGT